MTPNAIRLWPVSNCELAMASVGPADIDCESSCSVLPAGDGNSVFAGADALRTEVRIPLSLGRLSDGSRVGRFAALPHAVASTAASSSNPVRRTRAIAGLG